MVPILAGNAVWESSVMSATNMMNLVVNAVSAHIAMPVNGKGRTRYANS